MSAPSDYALARLLREHPRIYSCRYDNAARNHLLQILFLDLIDNNLSNVQYLFPDGLPERSRPWSLSESQGALDGAEYTLAAKGRRCGHVFKPDEATYSCRTCTADDTCVLCTKCFEASDHTDHQIIITLSSGSSGCCDCGDPEAWNRPVICKIHTPVAADPSLSGESDDLSTPAHLETSIRATISKAFDYVCDVFSCAPEHMRMSKTTQLIRRNEELARLRPDAYMGPEDLDPHPVFALILWNDEKHTVDEVSEQIAKACGKPKLFGRRKAADVDTYGRSILHYSTDLDDLLKKARILEQIKVTVTIRSARDTFREQMCSTIVDWLSDIAGCSVAQNHNLLMRIICEEMLAPWHIGSNAFNLAVSQHNLPDHARDDDRLDRMREAQMHSRLTAIRNAAALVQNEARNFARDGRRNDRRIQRRNERQRATPDNASQDQDEEGDDDDDDDDDEEDDDDDDEQNQDDQMDMEAALNIANDLDLDIEMGEAGDGVLAVEVLDRIDLPARVASIAAGQELADPASEESEEDTAALVPLNDPNLLLSDINKKAVPGQPQQKPPPAYWLKNHHPWHVDNTVSLAAAAEDLDCRVRIDFLILYDLRMWKSLRNDLRHLYISTVVTVPYFKRVLGLRFAAVYTWLAQLFLIADREPDHSIINLSIQMLTTPSITAEIVQRGNFFTKLLAILYTYLTKRQVGHPEDVDLAAQVMSETGIMSNRRIHRFFEDLRFLLESKCVQDRIRNEGEYLSQFLDFLKLYQGVCPNERAIGAHVEFESESWMGASYIVRDIVRNAKQFCEAFQWSPFEDPTSICRAIRQVAKSTTLNSLGTESDRFEESELRRWTWFKQQSPYKFELELLGESAQPRDIISCQVEKELMSFHHPLHYTLSWLINCGRGMSRDQLMGLLTFTSFDLLSHDPRLSENLDLPSQYSPQAYMLALFDIPLRVCAWFSQMRANLWVRNGLSLKHQMGQYRSVAQREFSAQRDIYLLQVALVVCDPSLFLASILDRFEMRDWIQFGPQVKPGWEPLQMVDVAEDLLHLIIVLFSDRALLHPTDEKSNLEVSTARRDIIHALCFKPLSHSDLTERLSHRILKLEQFPNILNAVAAFKAPEGLQDSGAFELRDDCFDELDPYYAFYTKNQREEAEQAWKLHIAKKTSKPVEQVVFEPHLLKIKSGVFANLGDFTQTPLFGQVIFSSLLAALYPNFLKNKPCPPNMEGRLEAFLPTVLHLILLAIDEDKPEPVPSQISKSFIDLLLNHRSRVGNWGSWTILEQLLALLKSPSYENSKSKIRQIILRLQAKRPIALQSGMDQLAVELSSVLELQSVKLETEEDVANKKKESQARRERVLASFKKQQDAFMKNQTTDWGDLDDIDSDIEQPASEDTSKKTWNFPHGTCIFCQEDTNEQRLYGTLALMKESNILRQTPLDDNDYLNELIAMPPSLDQSADHIRPYGVAGLDRDRASGNTESDVLPAQDRRRLGKGFPSSHHKPGPVTTSCGHVMHYSCFETFNTATQKRHHFQLARAQPERLAFMEFVCPMCKALGNAFLPVIWKPKELKSMPLMSSSLLVQWLSNLPFLRTSIEGALHGYQKTFRTYASDALMPSYASQLASSTKNGVQGQARSEYPGVTREAWQGFAMPAFLQQDASTAGPSARNANRHPRLDSALSELSSAYGRLQRTILTNDLDATWSSTGHSDDPDMLRKSDALVKSLGFSISAVEIAQRGVDSEASTFLGKIPESTLAHLRILSETCSSYIAIGGLQKDLQEVPQCSKNQFCQLFGVSIPGLFNCPCLFSQDIFVFFAESSVYMVPYLHLDVTHVLRLCYLAEIVKVVVAFTHNRATSGKYTQEPRLQNIAEECENDIEQDFSAIIDFIIGEYLKSHPSDDEDTENLTRSIRSELHPFLSEAIGAYALAFLRKCLLLMHVRYGVDFSTASVEPGKPELFRVRKMLGLPSIQDILAPLISDGPTGKMMQGMVTHWIQHFSKQLSQSQKPPKRNRAGQRSSISDFSMLSLTHPCIFELVALPYAHDVFNFTTMSKKCPNSGRELADPCVCLFCGEIFCGQAACCAVRSPRESGNTLGGCYQHQMICGRDVGMFFIIRKCTVLFLNGKQGSFFNPPYLDVYGETDIGLKRRNQLFLNRKRYDKSYRDVWLSHGIHSAIARKLDGDVNTGGWETL